MSSGGDSVVRDELSLLNYKTTKQNCISQAYEPKMGKNK